MKKKYRVYARQTSLLQEKIIEADNEEEAEAEYLTMTIEGEVKKEWGKKFVFETKLIETPKDKLVKEIDQNLEDFAQGYPDYTAKQKDIVKKMANLLQEAKIMIKHKVID